MRHYVHVYYATLINIHVFQCQNNYYRKQYFKDLIIGCPLCICMISTKITITNFICIVMLYIRHGTDLLLDATLLLREEDKIIRFLFLHYQ